TILACMATLFASLEIRPGDHDDDIDPKVVRKLIADLGSDEFAEREGAMAALRKIGDPAIPFLRRYGSTTNYEIHRRVIDLLADIQKKGQMFCFTGHDQGVITLALVAGG